MNAQDKQPEAGNAANSVLFPAIAAVPPLPHIAVCICTYKRPLMLQRLLADLATQETDGRFTYSIVVADNDESGSGRPVVTEAFNSSSTPIKYCHEPRRGIANARNAVVASAEGDYLAFIDDDEFPISTWLLRLFDACNEFKVDGVLGPVRRRFDQTPPAWLLKSRLYDRPVNPTGMIVNWREARTGNVLLKKHVIGGDAMPFNPDFRAGEDHDFFRRKIDQGFSFIWSADAEVSEVLPPARWKRMYFVRKALLQGATAAQHPDCGYISIVKSIVALPLYIVVLPFTLPFGQQYFITTLTKFCFHLGKLLIMVGINPVSGEYVSE